jgi:peptide/nickel transport system permease protein
MMWWKFRKHKLAVISGIFLILLYLVAMFCEFVAPYVPEDTFIRYKLAPPTKIHLMDTEGNLRFPLSTRSSARAILRHCGISSLKIRK